MAISRFKLHCEDIHRNSDINTFSDAIELILGQGGIVVRMGSIVTQELTYKHPRVIDYPHSGIRSDFLDVFLAAHCRFFLGTTSGICDLSVVFDVPNLRVNFTPPGGAPWGKESLFIPKRVHSKFTGKYVSFDKLINQFSVNSPNLWDGFYQYKTFGYRYEDNSKDEIAAVTKEMLLRLNGEYIETEEVRFLRQQYRALFPQDHWSYENLTPIGAEFSQGVISNC